MTTQAAHQRLLALRATFEDPVESQLILSREPIPDEVKAFMGRLRILESIPTNYLVPAPEMLPAESIRFFNVDKNWVNSLIDGAYSIGRVSELDREQDQAYLAAILHAAWNWVKESRPEASEACCKDPITGFILRSTLVSH